MVFLALLILPLLIAGGGYFLGKGKLTLKELALLIGLEVIVAGASAAIVHYSSMSDTEVWDGVVTRKWHEHVSCSHSYSCNCRSCNCDKKGNCSTCCDTCYEHSYDVDWNLATSNGEDVSIDRVDRQGLDEPPRWSKVVVGEPSAIEHNYTNYIKAAPDTLFRHQGLVPKYMGSIPKYPEVYDYYHLNRILLVGGAQVPDYRVWNDAVSKVNADIGKQRQANLLVVLAQGLPQEYFYALEEAWIGAKKNDVVLVIGVDGQTPQWATVMCWTTQELFKVKLRDAVMSGPLTVDKLALDLRENVEQNYVRKPMADFQYLEASITPTPMQWTVSMLVGILVAIIGTIVGIRVDIFGEERQKRLFGYEDAFRSSFGRRKF